MQLGTVSLIQLGRIVKNHSFWFHAHGTPRKDNDYDFFVVLKDDTEKPILVLQKINRYLARKQMLKPVDVLVNYKLRFKWHSTQPTIERRIANEGMILYERQ